MCDWKEGRGVERYKCVTGRTGVERYKKKEDTCDSGKLGWDGRREECTTWTHHVHHKKHCRLK